MTRWEDRILRRIFILPIALVAALRAINKKARRIAPAGKGGQGARNRRAR